MKKQNGISLIALIITIIVIIVLAVLIIGSAVTTPEKANIAKFTNDISEIQQAVTTKVADNQMQYVTDPDNVNLNAGFTRIEVVGAPNDFNSFPLETGEEGTIQGYLVNLDTINMERSTLGQGYKEASIVEFGNTDAFVYDANGQVYYAKGYNEGTITSYSKNDAIEVSTKPINYVSLANGVNAPVLGTGMVEVYWDASNNEVVRGAAGFEVANWYNYIAQSGSTAAGGTSKWANAKTSDGSYFVWIPRYAYKITYYTDSTKTTISPTRTEYGSIDVLFLYGTSSTRYIDKATNTIKLLPSDYIVHPAFTANIGNGGWDSELTGIWVGKYEASHNDATSGVVGTSTVLKVVPTVKSWVSITIGDAYSRALAYKPSLNSHMVKLSEWGAAAYLAHSKYGRNGTEVTINNNTNKLTGYAGGSVSASQSTTNTYAYNTSQGVLASTTGNIYGIYDMSGGVMEQAAAYCPLCTDGDLTTYGGSFIYNQDGVTISTTGSRFVTAYNGIVPEVDYKNGDATYETDGFNGDFGGFCFSTTGAFTALGGSYSFGGIAGIFCTPGYPGSALSGQGFRVCLCF